MIKNIFLLSALLSTLAIADSGKGKFLSDRPGAIDNPENADPGKFRIETLIFGHSQERNDETSVTGTTFLNVGVTERAELQFGFGGLVSRPDSESGASDTILRYKVNLALESSRVNMAILPFVILPTGKDGVGSDKLHGGINLPTAITLSERFTLGLMPSWGHVPNINSGTGLHHQLNLGSILVYAVNDGLDVFVQSSNYSSSEDGAKWNGTYGTGLAFRPRGDLQFDMELNSGITKESPYVIFTTGLTYIIN